VRDVPLARANGGHIQRLQRRTLGQFLVDRLLHVNRQLANVCSITSSDAPACANEFETAGSIPVSTGGSVSMSAKAQP